MSGSSRPPDANKTGRRGNQLIEETEFWWLGFLEGEMTLIYNVDLEAPKKNKCHIYDL
jgi:hypothetical protein